MKKTFYLLSGITAAMFTTSCKKDYTCKCVNTYTYSYNGIPAGSDSEVDEFTIKEASKHAAKSNCLSMEAEQTYSYGTYTYSYKIERSCELK